MFQPIRVAVCGRKAAPPLFETLAVLGPTCLEHIGQAIRMCRNRSSKETRMSTSTNERDTAATAPIQSAAPSNFIREIIVEDLKTKKFDGRVQTRFPPEPNGYLHIGHAKTICLNFGWPQEFGGKFNLRFDDTNPDQGREEYVDSIIDDVRWLGGKWEDRLFYASDYFQQLYDWAVQLIKRQGVRLRSVGRGSSRTSRHADRARQESPYRNRSVEENLDLFERMRRVSFPDGARTCARRSIWHRRTSTCATR